VCSNGGFNRELHRFHHDHVVQAAGNTANDVSGGRGIKRHAGESSSSTGEREQIFADI
jgi:hypothetical protein